MDPKLEQFLISRIQRNQFEVNLTIDPNTAHEVLSYLTRFMSEMNSEGYTPVIVVMHEMRLAFKRFFESTLPRLVVISYQEIPANTEIENYGIIPAPAFKDEKIPEAANVEVPA